MGEVALGGGVIEGGEVGGGAEDGRHAALGGGAVGAEGVGGGVVSRLRGNEASQEAQGQHQQGHQHPSERQI